MTKCPNRSLPEYGVLLAEYKTKIATDNIINAWQDLNQSENFPTLSQAKEFVKNFKVNQSLKKQEFGLALLNNLSRLGYADNINGVYFVRKSRTNNNVVVDSNRTKIRRYLEFNNIPSNAVSFVPSGSGNTYSISVDTEMFGPNDIIPETRGFNEPKTVKILNHLNSLFPELNIQVATIEEARNYYDTLPDNMKANVKFDDLKSFYVNGKVYLVKGRVTDETAIEEVLHPFVDTLFYQNRPLFDNLLQEARANFPKLASEINTAYSALKGFSQEERDLELVTQSLSRHFNKEYEKSPTKTFLDRIREFLEWFMSIINDYHKYLTGYNISAATKPSEEFPIAIASNIYELSPDITDQKIDQIYENYVALMNRQREGKAVPKESFLTLMKNYQVFNYKNTYIFGQYDTNTGTFITRLNSSPTSRELLAEAIPNIVANGIDFISFVPKDYADKLVRSGYTSSLASYEYDFKGEIMQKYAVASNPTIFKKIFNKGPNQITSEEIEKYNDSVELRYKPVEINAKLIVEAGRQAPKILETYLKQFGILVKDINEIKDQLGIDEVGFADILSKIAYVKDRKDLPPIAGEFIAYMMQYNNLVQDIINDLSETENYKNLDKSQYFKIIGKLISDDLQNKLEGNYNKSLVDKIKELVRKFFELFKNVPVDKINTNIGIITNNILQQNKKLITSSLYKPGAYGKETKKVSIEDALAKDKFGASVIYKLAKQGFILTGSTSLSEQGTILRPDENPLHDIDWVSPFTRELTEQKFLESYPDAIKVRDIYGDGYVTDSYLIAPDGYQIKNYGVIDYSGKIIIQSYDVVDSKGKVVGSYNLQRQEDTNQMEEVVTGVEAKVIDFFSYENYNTRNRNAPFPYKSKQGTVIQLANWKDTFNAKLEFARYKDIWDYNRFIPNENLAAQRATEALGFNQLITPKDKVVFGHPTIGKSFLKQQGENKFISLDDDYATEINNKVREIANKYNVTTYQVKDGGTQNWNNEYNKMMQEIFDVAKQRAISENKTLFTSNTNLLRNNAESFDKVINLTDQEFEKRIQERGAKYNTKEWKAQINDAISKIPADKVITTDKYLSDLFQATSKQEIKPGVEELFDSNPELAQSIYEALGFIGTKSGSQLDKLKTYLKEEDYRLKTPAPSWITDPTTSVGKMLEAINIPIVKDTVAFLREQNEKIQSLKSNANLLTNDLYKQAGINPVKLLEDESIQIKNIQRVRNGEERLPTPELDKLNALKISNRDLYEKIEDLGDKQSKLIRESSNAFEKEVKKFFNSLMEYEQKELGAAVTPQQKQQALQLYSQYLDQIFPDSKVKDILYHTNTRGRIETFNSERGLFVTPTLELAKTYKPGLSGKRFQLLINAKKIDEVSEETIMDGKKQSGDTLMYSEPDYTEYVVFEPKQIHELGTEKDIEGFKNFIQTGSTPAIPVTAIKPTAKLSDIAKLLNTSMLRFDNVVYDTNRVRYALSEEKQKIVDKALDQSNGIQKDVINRMFNIASTLDEEVDALSASVSDIESVENKSIVVLNKKNHTYYDILTGEAYTSATTAIKGKLKNQEEVELNVTLGNDFDFILDSIVSNKTLNEVLESGKVSILNEEQITKAFNGLQEVVRDLTADGSVAISQVTLFDEASKIAGTADLVIITPQGKLKILDLKTSKSKYVSIPERYDKEWDLEEDSFLKIKGVTNRLSTRQQHNLQLNLYRRMAENMGYEIADDEYATSTYHIYVNIKGKGKDQIFNGEFESEGWVPHPPSQNKTYVDEIIPLSLDRMNIDFGSDQNDGIPDFNQEFLFPDMDMPNLEGVDDYFEFDTVFNALQEYKTALLNRRDAIERIKSGIYMDRRTEQIIENIDNTVGAIMVALSEGGELISSTYTDLLRDAIKEVDQFTEYMLNPENFDKAEYINYALNFDRFLVTFNGLTEIQNAKDVNATQSKLLLALETKLRSLGGTRTKSGIIDAAIMNYVKETVRNTSNREFTEDELDELMRSARDITSLDLNTRDMATSPDTLLAIMDKIYKFKKQELYDKIDLREEEIRAAASKLLKLSPTSDRNKIYDFMLEYDDKGNFTGRYVKPLGKQYYDKIDQLRSKLFDEEGNWKEYREVDDITTAKPEDIAYNKELYKAKQAYTNFWRAETIGVNDKPVDGEYHGYTDDFKEARLKHEVFIAEGTHGYWVRRKGVSDKAYMNYKLKYFDTVETKFAVKKDGNFTGKVTDGTITVPKVKYRFAREITSKGEDMRNPKYKDIMNPTDALGEARKEFYELYVKHYENDLLKKLPTSVRDSMLGRAPLVESNLINQLKGRSNLFTKLWAKTTRSVKNLTTETSEMRRVVVDETGQFVDTLPIFFVGNPRDEEALAVIEGKIEQLSKERKLGAMNAIDYKKQKAELEGKAAAIRSKPSTNEISTDLGDSLLKFSAMAEHYETMGTIEDTMNAMIYVLERREYEPADDRISRVAKVAGKVTKIGQKKGALEPNAVRRAKKFMSMVFYDSDEVTKGMRDKIVDKLINASSMTYVAFNPFGNLNNYVMGRLNNNIEALGQRFVSTGAYTRASLEFNKRALPDVVKRYAMDAKKFTGGQYDPTLPMSKYEAFVDFFRMMDPKADVRESRASTAQKSRVGTFFEKMGYGIQDAAEYNVQTKMGMAIVMDTMLKNKTTGETLSLYDAAEFDSVTHKLKFKDGFDTIVKKNGVEVKFDATFRYDLRNRIREVIKQVHGNYAREDRMVIQSYALGKLAAQFHKWVAPAVRARFGKEYFDENLGWMEGRYMSFWSFMGYFFRNLDKIEMTGKKMKEGFLKDYGYIGDGSQADAKAENKLYNMYRTLGELGIMISVMIAKQILDSMWSDDDDDSEIERRLENALLFQADRSLKEMRTFVPVFGFSDLWAMLKSPVAATRTLAEYGQALGSTALTGFNGVMYMATDDPEYWEGNKKIVYQNRPDKGKLKMAKEWRDAIPMLYTWQRWESYTDISDFYIK